MARQKKPAKPEPLQPGDAGRLGEFEEPSDDAIRVLPGDDEIVVYYETKE